VVSATRREGRAFIFFPALSRIHCPTLVLDGKEDPMFPIECQEDIAAALPSHLVAANTFRIAAIA
jgi:pimeloyl-ACP methyl ester carboxylesterase